MNKSKISTAVKSNSLVDLSAFDDAFEGLLSDFDQHAPALTVSQCEAALLDECFKRIAGFVPREDNTQDMVNKNLAMALRDHQAPLQAWASNLMDTLRVLKQTSERPSNAAECGVTDAPVGTTADLVRDKIEALLIFGRAINRQVARASFYRIRAIEKQFDAFEAKNAAKRNTAGVFTGEFVGTFEDRDYPGWNRVQVNADTVQEAAENIGASIGAVYRKFVTAGATSQWFASNQPFDYGSMATDGGYTHFVSLADSHENLAATVTTKVRERASAALITAGFKL